MCQRNPGISGNGQGRTDPGHNLKLYAGSLQSIGFFRAASKQKWIAAFQAHDSPALSRIADEHPVNLLLRGLRAATNFAGVNALGSAGNVIKYFGIYQIVVKDEIAR